jgi:hypothetical protein
LILTTTTEGALKKLAAGHTQYVVAGLYTGLEAMEGAGIRDQVEVLPNYVISEGLYVAISKKSPCVKYRDHLSGKIAEYVKQGIPEKLVKKYTEIWKKQSKMKVPETLNLAMNMRREPCLAAGFPRMTATGSSAHVVQAAFRPRLDRSPPSHP